MSLPYIFLLHYDTSPAILLLFFLKLIFDSDFTSAQSCLGDFFGKADLQHEYC